jgi:hypothetical protein
MPFIYATPRCPLYAAHSSHGAARTKTNSFEIENNLRLRSALSALSIVPAAAITSVIN